MRILAITLLSASFFSLAGCKGDAATTPHVYVALDQEISERVLDDFAEELGISLDKRFDSEANKTVGLVSAIIEERSTPRCSVFWNNELAHTVHLGQLGLLEPYDSPSAAGIPARWRDPEHRWTAFAGRARVLIVNTEMLPDRAEWPTSYKDLADPKWKGRCAIAVPLTGTTMTHFVALRQLLGDEALTAWIEGMQQNDVEFLQSNGATMRAVREGRLAFAFTDTDDFHVAKQRGFPVACVFPDQHEGGIGTMLIPNSVALIKGGPAPEQAKLLIDRILARETEALLAAANSAQIPLRQGVTPPSDVEIKQIGSFRELDWDIDHAGKHLAGFKQDFDHYFGK